ncbi:MAG: DUF302 domain-containing protein, partial [Gammaproteobacteria bacterium]|nr:DUF302 domain-containing protein [Gammaproteobacteria bacterium]
MLRKCLVFMLLINASLASAANDAVFKYTVNKSMDLVYADVYKGLENAGFYVVFEADIGANISRFAEKWGDNYNRNQLESIRSMVFCNGWYANAVSNADPDMLALCPLRMSLVEKAGKTSALFARPSVIASGSAAKPLLEKIESEV